LRQAPIGSARQRRQKIERRRRAQNTQRLRASLYGIALTTRTGFAMKRLSILS